MFYTLYFKSVLETYLNSVIFLIIRPQSVEGGDELCFVFVCV